MPEPVDCTAAQMNREVSRPSRATAMNATTAIASGPMSRALSRRPCSSPLKSRAVRFIQKIIQVTKPTAMMDRNPPNASWAWNDIVDDVNVRRAPKVRLSPTASPTPIHTGSSASRRSVFTR